MLDDNPELLNLFIMLNSDFTEWEAVRGGATSDAHLRGAELASFISRNKEKYRALWMFANPDDCQRLLGEIDKASDPGSPMHKAMEDLTRAERARKAYDNFCQDLNFIGSHKDQVSAFKDYVDERYPEGLEGFTNKEAEHTIRGVQSGNNLLTGLSVGIGMLLTAVLAFGIFISAQNAKPAKPAVPKDRDIQPGLKIEKRNNPWEKRNDADDRGPKW